MSSQKRPRDTCESCESPDPKVEHAVTVLEGILNTHRTLHGDAAAERLRQKIVEQLDKSIVVDNFSEPNAKAARHQ